MLKKLLTAALLFAILATNFALFVPSTVRAQAPPGPWYNQSPVEFYSKVYDENNPSEIFGERYTVAQVDWIVWSVITWLPTKISPKLTLCSLEIIFGGGVTDCITTLLSSVEPEENKYALESNESLVEAVFSERPLSGITYFKNIARKLSLTPEARAQAGFGFEALDPILPMWRASRDIAYAIFVLVAVVLAFMIMFRVKISPQVIITVQSALPKLFIAIILVTFSYAIAGLLVDLMYVAIGIVSLFGAGFLPDVPLINETTAIFNFLTKGQPFGFVDVNLGVMGLIVLYLNMFMLAFVFIIAVTLGGIGTGISIVLAGIGFVALGLSGGLIIVGIIALVLLFILSVLIIWMAIKTAWMLVKAFASILLLTIFAPFQITIGVLIPGIGFGAWLKSFVANLAVFVTTGLLFFLSFVFIIQAVGLALKNLVGDTIAEGFLNAFFGTAVVDLFSGDSSTAWPPLLGASTDSSVPFLFLVVSLVIFFIIPKTADIIKAMIEGKPFAYGTAIGEAFGPVTMAGRTYSDYAAGQIREGQPVKPFGKYMDPENWSEGVKAAAEGILGAFGRRRR